jgi:asparagine synthase (glutamine-hydrolysing)
MCGIGGILTARNDLDLGEISQAMLASLRHRGPDDEGAVELRLPHGYRLGLVHSRLSILDPTPAGHQPMESSDGSSWISFNGEIYNHLDIRQQLSEKSYRSTCDTKTLLRAWRERGVKSLDLLRGMFAFALYDHSAAELYLVRDRLGIKPLYIYQFDASTWVFASELRALLASDLVPRRLNPVAIDSYLAFGAVTSPWTMVEGVESLRPGEFWRFKIPELGRPLVPDRQKYWQLPFAGQGTKIGYDDAVELIRPALLEAVSSHMLSDVPVGVFLSGGIDSSSLVAALAHCGHSLHTFTVDFGEREYDESEHAATVARKFGTNHQSLMLSPTTVCDQFETALAAYDQPSIDGFNTYFISRAVADVGIKVALSGLGGDELFAGYQNFRLARFLDRPANRFLARCASSVLRWSSPGAARTEKLDAILQHGASSRLRNYAIFRQVMMPGRRQAALDEEIEETPLAMPEEVVDLLDSSAAKLDPVNAYSLFELSLYVSDMLLRDADQMSMVHPVEIRVPFLDHRLVETIAALPGDLKVQRLGSTLKKRLLVDALPAYLPTDVTRRRKMGFVLPWELWLRNQLREPIESVLGDESTLRAMGLRREAVQELSQGFQAAQPGIRHTDILALVNLLNWVRQHRLSI